ncbi:hypothetical protein M9Y10_023392 [Tritrichomonas musculus]|uniref:BEACH domain-containing protein n=1 Tax=Tritrichomonas musculus TaxID=1915356 RepID=A0ABR2KY59_9EUKA
MDTILNHFHQLKCPEYYDICIKYFSIPINSNQSSKQTNIEPNPAEFLINDLLQIISTNENEVNQNTPTSAQIDYIKGPLLKEMKSSKDFYPIFNRFYCIDNYPIFKTAILAQMAINNKLEMDASKARQQQTQNPLSLTKKSQPNLPSITSLAKYLATKNIHIFIFKALISLTLLLFNYKETVFEDEEINVLQKDNFAALYYLLKYFDIFISNEDIQQYIANNSTSESSNKKISSEKVDISDFFSLLFSFLSFFQDNFRFLLILKEKNSTYFNFFTSILTTVVQMMPKFTIANKWDFYLHPISFYFSYFSSKQVTFQKYDILAQMYLEMCNQIKITLNDNVPEKVQTKILLLLSSVINNFDNEKNLMTIEDKLKISFESLSLFPKLPLNKDDNQSITLFTTSLINLINTISTKYQTDTDFENIQQDENDNIKSASVYHDSHDAILNSEKPGKLQYMNPQEYFNSRSLMHFFSHQEAHPNPIVQDFVKSLKNFFTQSNYESNFILQAITTKFNSIKPSSLHILLSSLSGKFIKITDSVVDFVTHLLQIDIYKIDSSDWKRSQIQLNDSILFFLFGVISKNKGILPIFTAISHLGFSILEYLLPMFRSLKMIDEDIQFSKSFCQSHIIDMIRFNITQNNMSNEKTHLIMNEIVGFLQVIAVSNPRATFSELSFAQLLKDFLKIDEYVDIILPCFKTGILTTDEKCMMNILNQIALVVIQASTDENYVPTANKLILLLSETLNSLTKKSLKEYEDNNIFELISKFPSSTKDRESLVNSLKFFMNICFKFNSYIQMFSDLLVYQNLKEAFTYVKLDSEMLLLLLSMTMNTPTDLEKSENRSIQNRFAMKLLLDVIKDYEDELELLKYFHKICASSNSNLYQCYQGGLITYLLGRVDVIELQTEVFSLFKLVCSKFCSPMILNKVHYTMISSKCKLSFLNIILQMIVDDSSTFPVSSFFAFSGLRTGIYGPSLDLSYLTNEWSFSTSINIEKVPSTILNLYEGTSSLAFKIGEDYLIECSRTEKKEIFSEKFKTPIEPKKWTFLTFIINQREIILYINFENKEYFTIPEKLTYNGPAVIKIAEGLTGEIGRTYFFSTTDINKIKSEVLSNKIIKKESICSYDPRGAYMGEIIDAASDNLCHLMGTAVPFTATFREIIQNEGVYQLIMTYFSIVDSEEFFLLSLKVLTEMIKISDENSRNFDRMGGFRLLIGLLSMIDKQFFTIKVSQELFNLFHSLSDESQKLMFSSYWMNIKFISTLNYDYQIHFYTEEFYNACACYKGTVTLDFVEALLYEIDRNFNDNDDNSEDIKILRNLQLSLLLKIIDDVPKTIYRKLFQFQYILFNKNLDDNIQKELLHILVDNASSLITTNNQLDLMNFIFPFFLSKDTEIRKLALKLISNILTCSSKQQISKEFLYKAMIFIKDDEAKLFNECFKIMFLNSLKQQQDEKVSTILNSDILDESIPTNSIADLLLSSTSTCNCIEMTPILIMLSIFYTKENENINKNDSESHENARDKVFNLMYHALPKLGRFYHDSACPLCLMIFALNFADNLDRFVEPFVVASFSNIQIVNYILPIFNSFSKFSKTDVSKWKRHFLITLIQRSIKSSLYIKEIATLAVQFMIYKYKPTEVNDPQEEIGDQINFENTDQINTENETQENEGQDENDKILSINNEDLLNEKYDDVSTKEFSEKDSIEFINYLANSSSSSTLDQAYIFEPCFLEDETFLELLYYLLYLLIHDKKYEDNRSNIDLPLSSTMNYSVHNLRKIIAALILKINPNSEIRYQLVDEFRSELNINNNLSMGASHSQEYLNTQGSSMKKTYSHPLLKTRFRFWNRNKKDPAGANENGDNENNENNNPDGENEQNTADLRPSVAEENYIFNLTKEGDLLGSNLIKALKFDWQFLLDIKPIFFNFRTEILGNIFKSYNNFVENQQRKESESSANSTFLLNSFASNISTVSSNEEPRIIIYNINSLEYLEYYSKDILKSHKRFMKTVGRRTFMFQKYNQKLATTYLNESNEKLCDSTKKHWKLSSKLDSLGRKIYFSVNRNFNDHMDASRLRDSNELDEKDLESRNKNEEQIIPYKRILELNQSLLKNYKKDIDLSFEVMMVTVIGKYKGTLMLSNKNLFFEGTLKYELSDNENEESKNKQKKKQNEKQKFVTIPLNQILFIFNRWTMHIDNSCEIFSFLRRSFFFIFPDTQTRRTFYNKINEKIGKNPKSAYFFKECCHICNGVCQNNVTNSELISKTNLTKDWQNRRLSNFRYLYFLNMISGRSFNDLSQYPVYPWILKDYSSQTLDLKDESIYRDLSVPIAAMNEVRLKECINHYEMVDPIEKCLYRSHYSSPAFIIGFMIRTEPFTSLHIDLQSGRFDYPDRLFYSVRRAWEGVTSTSNDYKELIPQFFTFPQMFINENKFDLGRIQGKKYQINDVEMPNWAKSPFEFVEIHQRALESEYVRLHLNEWIDLIFGCYQQSFEKHSLYHWYSYHECMKIPEVINDPINQQMAQHHSVNFGCCPDKIFTSPSPRFIHNIPKSLGISPISPLSSSSPQLNLTNTSSSSLSSSTTSIAPNDDVIFTSLSSNQVLDAAFNDASNIVYNGKGVVLLKSGCVFSVMKSLTQLFKISMQIQPNYKDILFFPNQQAFIFLQRNGGFASCVTFVTNQQNQQKEVLKTIAHKSSTIECMCVCGATTFATGGSDCCIKIWNVPNFTLLTSIPIQSGPIVALASDSLLEVIVSIDSQNMVYLSSINPNKHVLSFSLNMPENVTKHQVLVLRTGLIAVASDSADRKKLTVTFYDLRGIFIKQLVFDGSVAKFFAMYPSYGENFVVILVAQNRKLIVIDLSTFDVVSPFKGHVSNNFIWPFEDRRAILYLKNNAAKDIAVYEF